MGDTAITETTPVQAPAPAEPAAPATPASPAAPTAGDDSAAFGRIQAERDSLKGQVAELEKKLSDAKTLDDIEAAKKQAADEAQATLTAKMLDLGIEVALTKAGCINTRAAKALIDTQALALDGESVKGLDVAALVKEVPYLFQTPHTVSTGAPPSGTPADKDAAMFAALRDAAGCPTDKKE